MLACESRAEVSAGAPLAPEWSAAWLRDRSSCRGDVHREVGLASQRRRLCRRLLLLHAQRLLVLAVRLRHRRRHHTCSGWLLRVWPQLTGLPAVDHATASSAPLTHVVSTFRMSGWCCLGISASLWGTATDTELKHEICQNSAEFWAAGRSGERSGGGAASRGRPGQVVR